MFLKKRVFIITISVFLVMGLMESSGLFTPSSVKAQYWTALPPYNLLWPLWSPVLSPPDPVTGLSTPVITELTNSTILPIQPGLVWDPSHYAPWAIYNIPATLGGGLVYFDQLYGLDTWPPSLLLDPATGAPAPLALPLTWSLLTPTDLGHFEWFFPLANITYAFTYGLNPQQFLNLLTPAQIWGLPPISPF